MKTERDIDNSLTTGRLPTKIVRVKTCRPVPLFLGYGELNRLVSTFLIAVLGITAPLSGDDGDRASDHPHSPVIVRSRPVIERLPVRVIRPVDVIYNALRETVIADADGQVIFRINSAGDVSVICRDLPGISRIADASSLGLHVLTTEQRAGRIFRVTDNGFQEDVCELPFPPTGLGADRFGNLWTCDSASNSVVRITSDGQRTVITRLPEAARDLVVDEFGALILLESGAVRSVTTAGDSETIGYLPSGSVRLRTDSDGRPVALRHGVQNSAQLCGLTTSAEAIDCVASVPAGTTGFAFDHLGNLILANPELRAVTKVTSQFRIPCPHCGKLVPMVFSADAPVADQPLRRSF
ncbi:MAG: hypothetical protein R3C49_12350 [Planctomycetaceae bacterium]